MLLKELKRTPYFILLIFMMSCSKYPDNEGIQLTKKEDRLRLFWTAEYADMIDGEGSGWIPGAWNVGFKVSTREFTEDFGGELRPGHWEFTDGKKFLRMDFDNGDIELWRILRLDDEHLWVEFHRDGFPATIYVEFYKRY